MIKMTVIRKRSSPNLPEMIIISVILKWYNDRHLKKPFRFIFDLWRICPFILKWQCDLPFGMTGGTFDYDCPAPSFRMQGGFTSCHNEKERHFLYHKKWCTNWCTVCTNFLSCFRAVRGVIFAVVPRKFDNFSLKKQGAQLVFYSKLDALLLAILFGGFGFWFMRSIVLSPRECFL